jgi:hypothetical protein
LRPHTTSFFVTELSRQKGSKAGVSAILAFKMVFGDMNDTMFYPTLSNSTEEMLKFSKPDVAACSPLHRLKGGSEGFPEPRLQLATTLAAEG